MTPRLLLCADAFVGTDERVLYLNVSAKPKSGQLVRLANEKLSTEMFFRTYFFACVTNSQNNLPFGLNYIWRWYYFRYIKKA